MQTHLRNAINWRPSRGARLDMSDNDETQANASSANNQPPTTPSMEDAIAAIHEQREAVEHIRATKVKLYGLLQRNDLDESILGPALLELEGNFRSLHPEAIRNEDARQRFNEQVESVLHKGMEIMHIFNNEFRTLKDLEPYREEWKEEDYKRKWAELLANKTPKGKGKGKGKGTSNKRLPEPHHTESDGEDRASVVEEEAETGAQNHTTRSTKGVRNRDKNKSKHSQVNEAPGRNLPQNRAANPGRESSDSGEMSSGFLEYARAEYRRKKKQNKRNSESLPSSATGKSNERTKRTDRGNETRASSSPSTDSGQERQNKRNDNVPLSRQNSSNENPPKGKKKTAKNQNPPRNTRDYAERQARNGPDRNQRGFNQNGQGSTSGAMPPFPPYFNQYGQPWMNPYGGPYTPWMGPYQFGFGTGPYGGDSQQPRSNEWSNQMLEEAGIQKRIKYPKNWKVPPPNQIPPEYRYYDVQRVISQGMIKPFMGSIEDYPRFQQSFYNMIHIQPGPIFQKVLALDKLITDEDTVAMLAGLGTTAGDYLSRIERLEQAYGGPNRLKNHHLRVLRKLDGQVDDSLDNFKLYTYAVDNYLKNSPDGESENLVLLHMIKGRMSRALRVEYNAYLQQERLSDDNQSMSLFLRNKLTTEIEAREEETAFPNPSNKTQGSKKSKQRKAKAKGEQQLHQAGRTLASSTSSSSDSESNVHCVTRPVPLQAAARKTSKRQGLKCLLCSSDQHFVTNCEQFFLMSSDERRKVVSEAGACYICLNTNHKSGECPKREIKRCGICKGKHHYLLHPRPQTSHQQQWTQAAESSDTEESDNAFLGCAYQQAKRPKSSGGPPPLDIAITYLTVWLKNPNTGVRIKVNMLADSGANSCSIDTEIGRELGLSGKAEPYHVQVGGGRINTYSSFAATITIQGVQPDAEEYPITVQVYDKPCGSLARIDWNEKRKNWKHLAAIALPEAATRNVEGIIGMSEPLLLAAMQPAVTGGRHEPTATLTRLGWFVGGPVLPNATHSNVNVTFMNQSSNTSESPAEELEQTEEELRKAMQRFWEPDGTDRQLALTGPDRARMAKLEEKAIAVFNDTVQRLPDGKFQVGLLWRNRIPLPNNFHEALRMFYTLEKQMEQNVQMRVNFNQTVIEWINKNIACYVESTQLRYFIPTFMVVRADKATSAYRLVVDGARKFQGTSINDRLLPGPSMIHHIFDVLCRFRMGSFAFTCDVQTMYLNVKVDPKDRKYLGIFFREAANQPLRTVQLTSHPFGLTSSPYVAMQVVARHASARSDSYPLAGQAVAGSVIVDDFVVSGDNAEVLGHTLQQITSSAR